MGLEARKVGKEPGGRCARCTPQPSPLGKATYVTTDQSWLQHSPALPTSSSSVGDWD